MEEVIHGPEEFKGNPSFEEIEAALHAFWGDTRIVLDIRAWSEAIPTLEGDKANVDYWMCTIQKPKLDDERSMHVSTGLGGIKLLLADIKSRNEFFLSYKVKLNQVDISDDVAWDYLIELELVNNE